MGIAVDQCSFAYGDPGGSAARPALDGVTIAFPGPELVGLLGPNGSGKTTLLKCLNRKLVPDRGTVLIDGRDLAGLSRPAIARQVGVVPQQMRIGFPFTAGEVVLMGRSPHLGAWRGYAPEDHRIAQRALERVGAAHLADRPITGMSGGECQRIVIARALAQQPAILLLDEPTLHLDLNHQLELMELLRDLVRTDGLLVIMATHDMNWALRYADRLVLMHDGHVEAVGDPAQVLTADRIGHVFGVAVRIVPDGGDGIPTVIPLRAIPQGPI